MTVFVRRRAALWYPTVSRWKNASQSENKNKPGGIEFHDQVTYFYLDFTAELPDELFSTDWQGDLLPGITFRSARRETDVERPRQDPAAGRSATVSESGAPITVQAGGRGDQRLEAAPAKDLDKWVVELERIIGQETRWVASEQDRYAAPTS